MVHGFGGPEPCTPSPNSAHFWMENALRLDRIFLGDCRELLARVPNESVDLVVSSPPYNLGKEYEPRRALEDYLEEQRTILVECVRVLKSTGSIFWQVGAFSHRGRLVPLDVRFFPILEDIGLIPRNRIAWIRQHGLHARRRFSCRYETILWFTKSDDYVFDLDSIRVPQKYRNKRYHTGEKRGQLSCHPAGKNPGDIWAFRNVKHNHEERTIHPCQFPEDLIARIVSCSTQPGAIVLDPFMGAGTVAVVAAKLGRRFLGAEIDPRYHQVALRRLESSPDADGSFPNLKTLRSFVETNETPIEDWRYDVQISSKATPRKQARIHSEEHHMAEFEQRLGFEEESFAANLRGEEPPPDPKAANAVRSRKPPRPSDRNLRLFD